MTPLTAEKPDKIRIQFDTGQHKLSRDTRATINKILNDLPPKGDWKILVEAFTDDKGSVSANNTLSEKRAESVKKELVKTHQIAPEKILTVGYGETSPVDNNGSKAGRAKNRRVEISLLGPVSWELSRKYSAADPGLKEIHQLIQDAGSLAKKNRLDDALKQIESAGRLGGHRYASWHSTYGIIGYYSGIPHSKLIPMFNRALAIDPFNDEARDYLGRLKVREAVSSGQVTSADGQSIETPIIVTTQSQEYEYLNLFGVRPVYRQKHTYKPVHIWECESGEGKIIHYYFDYSQSRSWAFR